MLFIGTWCAAISLWGQESSISSEFLEVDYNKMMKGTIQWTSQYKDSLQSAKIGLNEGVSIDGVWTDGFLMVEPKPKTSTIIHPEFGKSQKLVVEGVFQKNDITILRQTTILLPMDFPNTAAFQTTYTNRGNRTVKIDSIHIQRLDFNADGLGDGKSDTVPLTSFQGGVTAWGNDYAVIPLEEGFTRQNFQGIHKTEDDEFIGGGIPLIDVWGSNMGIALCHLDQKPRWVSLPVAVGQGGAMEMGIVETPEEQLGMKARLKPGEQFTSVMNAVVFHELDYYNALKTYSNLLRARGIAIPKESPAGAHDPYWKSWGFALDFTLEEIYAILPELREIGVRVANLDDGWFDYYGDWDVNRSKGKFPRGESDMLAFVDRLHTEGFKTNLWWHPLGVSPESKLTQNTPEYLVMDANGQYVEDKRGLYQLCPAYQPALQHVQKLVERFVGKWKYDGLYSDTRGLSAVPPCFNPVHGHQRPLESFEQLPRVFEVINTTLKDLNKNALHEVCICAAPHSPYNMPYYDIANASDPVNLEQTRRRIKVEKALHGPSYAVGDCYQVPDDEWSGFSVAQSFESAVGIGAQATTFYTDLDPKQKKIWKRWFKLYNEMELSSAEYMNLYDIVHDKPEAHVVEKQGTLYYGFFAELWSKEDSLRLRGLKPGIDYAVYDYGNQRDLGTLNGDEPILHLGFKGHLLLKVTPINHRYK